jgi:hypothetical protein
MIGAFPAQYGNAVSGVFDLKMRSGNHEKHEFLGQIGFNGVELGAEGYLSKKKRSSYLVNYRYSALGIFKALGIPFGTGDAIPYYQDLSFKVDLPSGKNTKIFVFGVGGKSNIALKGSDKSPEDLNDFYGNASRNIDYGSYTYSGGISLMHFHNQNTFSKLIAGITTLRSAADIDTVLRDADLKVLDISRIQERNLMQAKYTLHYQLNTKMGAKNTLLSGFIADFLQFDLSDVFTNKQFESGFNKIGSTFLGQIYTDWQHKFNDKATLNLGLHAQSLALNQSFALEPRLAFKYQASSKLDFSLGYGRLSQMQGLQVYFVETYQNGKKYYTNEKLGFTLNNQVVAGAGLALTPKARLKFETYYQYLTNVPIEQSKTTFSMLNAGADFGLPDTDSLQNKGTGRNMGIELTLEHFFTDSYYYLFTVSVFDSKYTGSDGVERNTSFNGNYVSNALIGKEFRLNDRLRLSIDLKATFAGGRRYTPINLTESIKQQATIWETEKTNELQFDAYFRADGRVTLRRTGKKNVHQEWAFDVQNITNHKNIFAQEFNVLAQKVIKSYQLGFFPVVQYRILF